MNKEENADTRESIPGIYNYCDRWCERCRFTSRCENYASNESGLGHPAFRGPENPVFLDRLAAVLHFSIEMVEQAAANQEVDPSSLKELKEEPRGARLPRTQTRSVDATEYSESVSRWLESASASLERRDDELNKQGSLDLPGADPDGDANQLADAIDLVRFDQLLIRAQLGRAVGAAELERTLGAGDATPRDSNGSAKVALISIDRSIAAWSFLREQLPEEETPILGLLVQLSRLRREAESQFPAARSFVRPGFDESDR